MKITRILLLLFLIFCSTTALLFGETDSKPLLTNGVATNSIATKNLPEQIAEMKKSIAAIKAQLVLMDSVLQDKHRPNEPVKTLPPAVVREWSYWESGDYESH